MAHEFPPLPTHRLEDIIAAFRGLARVVDPEPDLDGEDRSNLYFLLMLLTDHLDACLREIMHDKAAILAALKQAQTARPTPEED